MYRRFVHEGITFTVLGVEDVSEQIIPIDCVPRLITADEWDHIERGLKQRLTALNLFLHDVYHDGKSLRDGVVPVDLVLGCPQYRLEMQGMKVPHDVYVAVCGTDIVRAGDTFAVLEDNLRVPSGVSYMLACRTAMKWAFPYLYRAYGVREVADYPERLYSTLASLATSAETPRMAVLTPGRYNSASTSTRSSPGRWGSTWSRDGISLCTTRRCTPARPRVCGGSTSSTGGSTTIFWTRSPSGKTPCSGPAGLFHAYRAGNLVLANAPGTGVADDKGLYAYVRASSDISWMKTPSWPTWRRTSAGSRTVSPTRWTTSRVSSSRRLEGRVATGCSWARMRRRPSERRSRNTCETTRRTTSRSRRCPFPALAASWMDASNPATWTCAPSSSRGKTCNTSCPGGLCRVALRKGSLVVNSSQGGGCKDLWILRE